LASVRDLQRHESNQEDANAAAAGGNPTSMDQDDWETIFREVPMYISDDEPTRSTARTHGRTNTTDKEKADAMLSNENLASTIFFLKKRQPRIKHYANGDVGEVQHACKKNCCTPATCDLLWLKDVRTAACEGTAQDKRAFLILQLRDGNTSDDPLPIQGCTVRGVSMCTVCFREVFQVRMYWTLGL
jgi:hypothetical protein